MGALQMYIDDDDDLEKNYRMHFYMELGSLTFV